MDTDGKRRHLAERMRGGYDVVSDARGRFWLNGTLFGMDITARSEERIRDGLARLADLIEPGDTSQSCRGDVDPTERGIDSIYEWCRERLEGADGAEDYLYCSIMRAIEDYRHPELATAHTVRAVDREALLALADEMSMDGMDGLLIPMSEYARRIREALGVVA